MSYGLDFSGSGQSPLASSCEDELSDFVKFGKLLDYLRCYQFLDQTLLHEVR